MLSPGGTGTLEYSSNLIAVLIAVYRCQFYHYHFFAAIFNLLPISCNHFAFHPFNSK